MNDIERKDGERPNAADEATEQTPTPQSRGEGGEAQDAAQSDSQRDREQGEPQGDGAPSSEVGAGDESNTEAGEAQVNATQAAQGKSKDEEIAELREQLMRAQAEFENAEKRRAREAQHTRKYMMESFVLELLEVKDNLERTLEALGDALGEDDDARSGLTLTIEHFSRILAQNHVEEVASEGEVFNPESHEAMHMQSSDEHPANTIIQTIQKGYRMHERLLRPARVIVSSGKAQAEDAAQTDASAKEDAEQGE